MRYLSLFSGIGGFELGIQRAYEENNSDRGNAEECSSDDKSISSINRSNGQGRGTHPTCIGYAEIDKYAIQIYEKHFNHKNYGNITNIIPSELPDFDLLVGGFPCQAFSIAGKRGGFNDTRGTLFFDIVRILRAKKPKHFLLENVKGLLSSKTYLTFDKILDILFEELTIKQNVCQKEFTPIKSWQIVIDNLSKYLQSIGGTNGLQKNWKSLHEKILPTIKKLSYYQEEMMEVLGLSVKEWDSNLNLLSSEENLTVVDTDTLEQTTLMLGDVGWLLKKHLEGSLKNQKLSIILTEINKTTDLKTCLSAIQEMSIIVFIVKQWKLSTTLWKKMSSNLINKKENTYYVKTFNIILYELRNLGYFVEWQVLNSKNFGVPQNRERVFIRGHLGGEPRRKVFPITGTDRENTKSKGIQSDAKLVADYRNDEGLRIRKKGDVPCLSTRRHSETDPSTMPPFVVNPYNGKTSTEETGTLGTSCGTTTGKTAQHLHYNSKIRRLTPTECERLQGFPDGWTEGVSDTQRYKTLGNAVTTNVIREIIKRMY